MNLTKLLFIITFLYKIVLSEKITHEFTRKIDLNNKKEINNIIKQLEEKILEINFEIKQIKIIETLELEKADKIIKKLRKIINNNYNESISLNKILILYNIYHAYHDIILPIDSKQEINFNLEGEKLITLEELDILETCKNGLLLVKNELKKDLTKKESHKTYKVLNELYKQKLLLI
jgi:hypothetical protein